MREQLSQLENGGNNNNNNNNNIGHKHNNTVISNPDYMNMNGFDLSDEEIDDDENITYMSELNKQDDEINRTKLPLINKPSKHHLTNPQSIIQEDELSAPAF